MRADTGRAMGRDAIAQRHAPAIGLRAPGGAASRRSARRPAPNLPAWLWLAAALAIIPALAACGGRGEETGAPGTAAGSAQRGVGRAESPAAPLPSSARSRSPGMAVLAEGSAPVRGLPGFGRNAIPGLAGAYELGAAAIRVEVWYTKESLVLPTGLAPPACRGAPAGFAVSASAPGADGSSLWFMSAKDYTLIAAMPAALADPCAFAVGLMDRFAFFTGYASRPEDVSFPAFIDLGS